MCLEVYESRFKGKGDEKVPLFCRLLHFPFIHVLAVFICDVRYRFALGSLQ